MKFKVFVISLSIFLSMNICLWSISAETINFAEELQKRLMGGDIDGAISLYKDIPDNLKDDVDLKILEASLLLSVNRLTEAKTIVNELKKSGHNTVEVMEVDAEIANASGKLADIQNATNALLKADPINVTANLILANRWALKKKYKLACDYYRKVIQKESDNEDGLFGYGQMNYYLGNLKESRKSFEKLAEIAPENSIVFQYMGKLAAEEENYKIAIENIQKAIDLNPENSDYYIDLGNYYRNLGRYADAEKAWTKSINLAPDYFLGYTYRAGLYDEQNKIEEALADYKMVVKTNPKYYFAFEEIGILEFHMENWEEARKYFSKANEISESYAYKLMILATYIKQGKTFEMKQLSEKYMKPLDRNSLEYKMIRLYHDQGPMNAENAIAKDIEKETNKNKKGKMKYYLALYYDMKGSKSVAAEYYNQITKLQTPMFFEYRLAEWALPADLKK